MIVWKLIDGSTLIRFVSAAPVTVTVADFACPDCDMVMLTDPGARPVTSPLCVTDATTGLLVLHCGVSLVVTLPCAS